ERRLRHERERSDDRPLEQLIHGVRPAKRSRLRVAELSVDEKNLAGCLTAASAAERDDSGRQVVAERLQQRRQSEELQIASQRRARSVGCRWTLLRRRRQIVERRGRDVTHILIGKLRCDLAKE